MKPKLQAFSDFAATLLPHETAWLLTVNGFLDPEKQAILSRLHHNCKQIHQPIPFDASIDKRKYSEIKSWIATRLHEVDADAQFEWLVNMERKIVTDAVLPEEERELLRYLRRAKPTDYFFVKFYELVQAFRHFLLIRFRHKEHKQADKFLKTHREEWLRAKKTYEQLHEATLDVVGQYATGSGDSEHWQQWLTDVFYDESLDGQNRYFALIRLIFVHLNYGRLSVLLEKFEYQDKIFESGVYYSKRLLCNFYSQRLLLHSKLKDYDTAAYYGYLSIRGRNSDYLFYVNNLTAVLLRSKKHEQALALLKSAHSDARSTLNFHNRIGYVAFYIRSLICNGQYKNAEGYATTFLKAYSKEILEYRWHLFFTNYLSALFHLGKYNRLIAIVRQYSLMERDRTYKQKSSYLPFIPWYCHIAEIMESGKGLNALSDAIAAYIRAQPPETDRLPLVWEFIAEVKHHVPALPQMIQSRLRDHTVVSVSP